MIKAPTFTTASAAAKWIADTITSENWCKGSFSQNADGLEANIREGEKFCSLGWTLKANQGFENQLSEALCAVTGRNNIALWNDDGNRTVEEVKQAFLEAVAYLEANNA